MLYTFQTSKKFKAQDEASGSADLQNIKFFPVFPYAFLFRIHIPYWIWIRYNQDQDQDKKKAVEGKIIFSKIGLWYLW